MRQRSSKQNLVAAFTRINDAKIAISDNQLLSAVLLVSLTAFR